MVNETHNKFHRNIEKDELGDDIPFETRLRFCLKNDLIPFLNLIKVQNGTNLIIITSDIINGIKTKSSRNFKFTEISSIIKGFTYGQKRIGVKILRTVYGTIDQLLEFLGLKPEKPE